MAIYRMTQGTITPIEQTTFADAGISERDDIQRLIRDRIDILAPDVLVIAEEFQNWDDSSRRIDLLGVDKDANLVIIELKRTEDGGHMELQAIRYAAMVSTMTFDQAVAALKEYLAQTGADGDPEAQLLQFLGWTESQEDLFGQNVRIVLASADFSRELTTAVMWLNERDMNIRCVRLRPYRDGDSLLLDVQQVIPLPEAEEYQIRVRTKAQESRRLASKHWDEASFFEDAEQRLDAASLGRLRQLYEWANEFADSVWWGRGLTVGSFVPTIEFDMTSGMQEHWYGMFAASSDGQVHIELAVLRKKPALSDKQPRRELMAQLMTIAGFRSDGSADRRVSVPLASLVDEKAWRTFKDALSKLMGVIRQHYESGAE